MLLRVFPCDTLKNFDPFLKCVENLWQNSDVINKKGNLRKNSDVINKKGNPPRHFEKFWLNLKMCWISPISKMWQNQTNLRMWEKANLRMCWIWANLKMWWILAILRMWRIWVNFRMSDVIMKMCDVIRKECHRIGTENPVETGFWKCGKFHLFRNATIFIDFENAENLTKFQNATSRDKMCWNRHFTHWGTPHDTLKNFDQ